MNKVELDISADHHSSPDYSIVVETFNYLEGTPLESVRRALRAAISLAAAHHAEVLLADVSDDAEVAKMVAAEFQGVRRIAAGRMGYDEAKSLAASQARAPRIVYLDCDCVPRPGWFEAITAPLCEGRAAAVGGFASYPGGYFKKLSALMDFGFLLPLRDRAIGCYASNNSAFMRDVLLAVPEPEGPMRCRCYAHAQELARRGFPVILAARAVVDHDAPPFVRERLRQGYDMVAACWVDPHLPEAKFLTRGFRAAGRFYALRVSRDFHTLTDNGAELGFSRLGRAAAYPVIAASRLIDLVGIVAALTMGPSARRFVDRSPRSAASREPASSRSQQAEATPGTGAE